MARMAVLCSGQGGQEAGFFELLRTSPQAMRLVAEAAPQLTPEAAAWLGRPNDGLALHDSGHVQQLLCLYQLAVWEALKPFAPEPELFAGYSLGELCAHGCAGTLSLRDVLALARDRGAFMGEAASATPCGLVAALGLNAARLEPIATACQAQVAIINASDHFVLGAAADKLDALTDALESAGAARVVRLAVPLASHCDFMAPAAARFATKLAQVEFRFPAVSAVLAGIDGATLSGAPQARAALAAQIHRTLRWDKCLDTAWARGCRIFLELGPGSGLVKMVLSTWPEAEARSASEFKTLAGVRKWLEARQ